MNNVGSPPFRTEWIQNFPIFWIRFCFKTHWSTTNHFRSECRSNLKWSKMAATESISDSLESMEVILRYFRLRRSSGISFDFLSSSRPTVVFILRFRIVLWIADTFDLRTLRFRERISFKMPFRAFTVKYGQREQSQTQWKRTYFQRETLWEQITWKMAKRERVCVP